MLKNITYSETKFYFGIEFEKRQIEITSEPGGKIKIRRLEFQIIRALLGNIKSRHYTCRQIRTAVAVAHRREFDIHRHRHKSAFDILPIQLAGFSLAHLYVSAAEIQPRRKTDIEIIVKPEVHKTAYIKPGGIPRLVHKPALPRFGNISVMGKAQILSVNAYIEPACYALPSL